MNLKRGRRKYMHNIYSRWNVKWITGTSSGSPYISVVYEQKWLKFCFQAHFLKMFGHTKFQLSITCTFRLMKLLVEITKYLHLKFDNSESKSDRELKFCVSKHLQKMCLETKFQPFRLRNDGDIERSTWNAKIHFGCQLL